MEMLIGIFIGLIAGLVIGFAVSYLLKRGQGKAAKEIADELFRESENQRKEERDAVIEHVKTSFGDLSLNALEKFISIAKEKFKSEREIHGKELETKKELIDQQLKSMTTELEKVKNIVTEFEKDREKKFGELTKQLEESGRWTSELIKTTNTLREALAHTKTRGQWGERMAEDVLRLAGFIENVNYVKQKSVESSNEIPDFTFFLPRNLILNMDVKFPFDNYLRYLESESDVDREAFRKNFLRDVKKHIRDVAARDYINPEQNTVDYVLLFIPNEQIFAFIHEQDSTIVDEGIKKRVIICSPITLFSVLAVIRAAVDNFALEQTSNKILSLIGRFRDQWGRFVEALEKLGKSIHYSQKYYETLIGRRKRQLEKPLNEIDEIRAERGILIDYTEDEKLLNPPDDE